MATTLINSHIDNCEGSHVGVLWYVFLLVVALFSLMCCVFPGRRLVRLLKYEFCVYVVSRPSRKGLGYMSSFQIICSWRQTLF